MSSKEELVHFLQIPNFTLPNPSPPSGRISLLKERGDESSLEIHHLATDSCESFSSTAKQLPCWDPGGNSLYYLGDSSDSATIWKIDIEGGSHKLLNLQSPATLEQVDRSGRYLFYTVGEELRRFDIRSGAEQTVLAEGPFAPGSPSQSIFISADGDQLAYTVDIDGSSEAFHSAGRPCIARDDGSEHTPLDIDTDQIPATADGLLVRGWHPDNRRLLIASHPFAGHCGVYDVEADRVEWFGSDLIASDVPFPGLEFPLTFLPDGNGFVAWRLHGTGKRLVVYDLESGSKTFAIDGEINRKRNSEPGFLDDERLLLVRESGVAPGDAIAINVQTGDIDTVATPGYGSVDSRRIIEPEFVAYEAADGETSSGVLYRPKEPTGSGLVEVYSGYTTGAGWPRTFRPEMQFLADNGLTILQAVNPADPFTDDAHANYAAAGEWLSNLPTIDPDSVGVYGFSLGGYGALMQAVRYPEIWSVCVSGDGFPDLFDADERAGGMKVIRDSLGDPDEDISAWRMQNPIDEIERMSRKSRVPTLLWATGDRPAEPFERLYSRMLDFGWNDGERLEYVHFDTQRHVEPSIAGRLERWTTIREFLLDQLRP